MTTPTKQKPTEAKPDKVVMVVDDDESVRTLVVKALSPFCKVISAEDGLVASEMLGNLRPDLLVCDVMMPRVDGFSLARLIRKRPELANMPIIFLTAKTGPAAAIQGIQLGAKHYMQNPFRIKELTERVMKLL